MILRMSSSRFLFVLQGFGSVRQQRRHPNNSPSRRPLATSALPVPHRSD
jgi:hypothetical protein